MLGITSVFRGLFGKKKPNAKPQGIKPEFPKIRAFLIPCKRVLRVKETDETVVFYRFNLRRCKFFMDRGDSIVSSSIEDLYRSKYKAVQAIREIGFRGDVVEETENGNITVFEYGR